MAAKKEEQKFTSQIIKGYTPTGPDIILGAGVLDGKTIGDAKVKIPLKTLNRHGLIAGATGTGKTKTLQIMAEQLSKAGVPSMVMDIKGDLSGIAAPGEVKDFITKRHAEIDLPYTPAASPVEFLSLSREKGIRLRATVSEFGPILLSRILDLNETQQSILAVLFKFCDEQGLLLLDIKDLKKALNFVMNEGKVEFSAEYGSISKQSCGTILRKIVALEGQGATDFFGERSFDIEDLLRLDENGHGIVSILRVKDIQDRPGLFSTFMLQLLAEVYAKLPEEGDLEQPRLCLFIDEAHLIFKTASRALLRQIETIIKLIRSKGVGIFFVTQIPTDVPDEVLSQLGLKIQHALRAFTAKDRKAIKKASENFPDSPYYQTDKLLTELGIGEALVTGLSEKGRPTPLVWTMLRAPLSRMNVLKPAEIKTIIDSSKKVAYYAEHVDRESAYELLSAKAEALAETIQQEKTKKKSKRSSPRKGRATREKSTIEKVLDSTIAKQVGRTVARELTRGLLGVFGIKTRRR